MALRDSIGIAIFGQQLNGKGYIVYAQDNSYTEVDEESRDRLLQMPSDIKYSMGTTIYSINRRHNKKAFRTNIFLAFNVYEFGGLDSQDRPTYYGASIMIKQDEIPDLSELFDCLNSLKKIAKKKHNQTDLNIEKKIQKLNSLHFTNKKIKSTSIVSNIEKGKDIGMIFVENIKKEEIVNIFNLVSDEIFTNYKTIFISNNEFKIDRFTQLKLISLNEYNDQKEVDNFKFNTDEIASTINGETDRDVKEDDVPEFNNDEGIEGLNGRNTIKTEDINESRTDANELIRSIETFSLEKNKKIVELQKILDALSGKIENKQVELDTVLNRIRRFKQNMDKLIVVGGSCLLFTATIAFLIGQKAALKLNYETPKEIQRQRSELEPLNKYEDTIVKVESLPPTSEDSMTVIKIVDALSAMVKSKFNINEYFALRKKALTIYDVSRNYEDLSYELRIYMFELDQTYLDYYSSEIKKMISNQEFYLASSTLKNIKNILGDKIIRFQILRLQEMDKSIKKAITSTKIHKVREGQTLNFVSTMYNVNVEKIKQLNPNLEENNLIVGQQIVIRN